MSGTFQGRLAYASCTITGAPPSGLSITSQSGDFTAAARSAAGQYTLTLGAEVDPSEACYQVTCRTLTGIVGVATIVPASTNDSTVAIEVQDDTGALTDPVGFDIIIVVKPAN